MITPGHLAEFCQPGHGATTCRYLMVGGGGWECAKLHPSLKRLLDDRVANNTIGAQGDHCEGR